MGYSTGNYFKQHLYDFKAQIKEYNHWKLEYADMINKVEPLRNELKELELAAETNQVKSQNLNQLINKVNLSNIIWTSKKWPDICLKQFIS